MKPKLAYASQGPFVVEAQTKLNTLMPEAHPPLKPDGKYFDKTVARVKQFQKSRGLVPDGLVGARTWEALDGSAPAVGTSTASSASPKTAPPPAPPHFKGMKVYSGASLKCSLGTASSTLTLYSAQPATILDCQAYVNIKPFGHCKAPHRVGGMSERYEDPILGASFDTGAPITLSPICTPVIVGPWSGSFGKAGSNDLSQVIDKTAHCLCMYTGIIRFK